MIPPPTFPQGPPPAFKVDWRSNTRRGAARLSALISLAMSGGLLALTGVSLALGDRSLLTLAAFVMAIFLLDGALTRLLAARRAPVAIGFSEMGLHVREAAREIALPWASIVDIKFKAVAPRPDTLTLTLRDAQIVQYSGVLPAIGSEAKLAWYEAGAHAKAAQRGVRPRIAAGAAGPIPPDLMPSPAPQYWVPKGAEDDPFAAAPAAQSAPGAVISAAAAPAPADAAAAMAARPEWGYTQPTQGAPSPDPIFHAPVTSVKPLVWHFLPTGVTRVSAFFLVALVVLAAVAVTRLVSDALLALAGLPSDPWAATLLGVAAGALLAAIVWRMARSELAGEVAGSVLFLPAFDRTKGEVVGALREAGAALGAGDPSERRSRGRLIVQWRSTRTRATIVQAAPDIRAIVLRTVGRSHYEAHARLKGAILERLKGPDLRK